MWGEYATRFEADNIQSIGKKESLIVIFVRTLPKTYKGQTSLSRSLACRWYINENIPEINALRASTQQRFTPLNIIAPSTQDISTQSQQAAMEEKTVAELSYLSLIFSTTRVCILSVPLQ